ncbi:RNA-editing complex protein mp100 [Perkinsela sp. CCAP 1560/4]|nr:RNA-editing complex protein mp100 [Perkinsela sp. CCAP 1560/4]|eukprot:KNH07943.1 RNA-editing complex protein mp100 [Perkinsela sp. CCAP 1560/4]
MWRSAAYRTTTTKLSELRHAIVTKTPWEFEHVAVDFLHPIEVSVSIKKNEWNDSVKGRRIFSETSRLPIEFYHKNIEPIISPTKSIAFFSDGSMPLWTLRGWRRAKKVYKLHHTPNSELMVSAEESIRQFIHDKLQGRDKFVSEVVISGSRAPGAIDGKICGWAADLAAREMSRNERIAIVGNTNQYITLMGMVPFHNISFFALAHQQSYQFHFYDMLDYFGLLPHVDAPEFPRIRFDMVFLMIMAYGLKWADIGPLSAFPLKAVLDAYHTNCIEKHRFLFDEKLRLNVRNVQSLLSKAKMPRTATPGQGQDAAREYLQVLLQTHYTLCTGRTLNSHYEPAAYNHVEPVQALPVQAVVAVIDGLSGEWMTPAIDPQPPVNGLAYGMVGIGSEFATQHTSLPQWVKAYKEPLSAHQKMMTMIECKTLSTAVEIAGELSQMLEDQIPPQVRREAPSFVLKRNFAGLRNSCTSSAFVLGALSQSKPGERTKAFASTPAVWDPALRLQTKPIMAYNHTSATWSKRVVDENAACRGHNPPQKLTVITWNILFDRFNNEKTFMGKPAIDRCSKQRYVGIAKVLERSDADVICLQEVMPDFYEYLVAQPWVHNYTLSCDKAHADINPWGSLILCHVRHTVVDSVSHNLPGYNGHISLMPEMAIKIRNDHPALRVSSCHLVAPYTANHDHIRKTQIVNFMRVCTSENGENAIRMGDFNEEWSFPAALNFQDAWKVAGHTERSGWTIDNSKNGLAGRLIEEQFNGRYDRILFKSKNLCLKSCALVGTEPIHEILGPGEWPEWLHCSDHFGVQANFDVR